MNHAARVAGMQNHARARDRGILMGPDDMPAFTLRAIAADTLRIGDRRRTLLVGGMAGIEGDADHRIVLCVGGHDPAQPVKTVSAPMTLASTLPAVRAFRSLIVVFSSANPDMLAGDMPPDRFRWPAPAPPSR